MMAASARMSGTSAPKSSNLKRGCWASASAFAAAAARALASAARRARADLAEYAGFFLVGGAFFVAVAELDGLVWADACVAAGSPKASTAATRQIGRTLLNSRARITGNPLRNNLL